MDAIQQRISRHLTLPELLDLLDVDYDDLDLEEFIKEREEEIEELLKDYE